MQKQLSDIELWKACLAGDMAAFAEIYNLYITELLSYGYRITNDRQLIKDSIHTLFLHIWEHRDGLSATDSIKFYLFRSLRNQILQKKRTDVERNVSHLDGIMPEGAFEISFEQLLIEKETRQRQVRHIREAIRSLSSRQQEIIQLKYYHNLPTEEIAALLEINNQSVRNLLHRSIAQLRAFFENLPQSWISSALIFFLL